MAVAVSPADSSEWAGAELGIHRSGDGGRRWSRVAAFDATPHHLRAHVLAA